LNQALLVQNFPLKGKGISRKAFSFSPSNQGGVLFRQYSTLKTASRIWF